MAHLPVLYLSSQPKDPAEVSRIATNDLRGTFYRPPNSMVRVSPAAVLKLQSFFPVNSSKPINASAEKRALTNKPIWPRFTTLRDGGCNESAGKREFKMDNNISVYMPLYTVKLDYEKV